MAKRMTFLAVSGTATVLGLLSTGCDKDSPTAPDPGRVTRLEVTGPESIAPSGTGQFRVTAHTLNGVGRDVTSEASWDSEDTSIVTLAPDGRATGGLRGETYVRAAFSGVTGLSRVMVLPSGTFKLSGRVLDADLGVADARVEVTAGSATGLWTSTRDGNYALYGVSGTTEVSVTKEGYHTHVERLDVNRHVVHSLSLALIAPRWDPSGTYTMTVTAGPECRDALPQDARSRTYAASIVVTSGGRYAGISFPGAQFQSTNWWFWQDVRIDSDSLTLEAYDDHNYGPALVERLSPSRYFVVEGTNDLARAKLFRSPTGLEGLLDATISIVEGPSYFSGSRVGTCRSVNHRVTFSR